MVRRFNRRALPLVCLVMLSHGSANGQSNERVYESFDFRFVTPGARAVGMGKAFTGLADDATAAFTNPAGLSKSSPGRGIHRSGWNSNTESPHRESGRRVRAIHDGALRRVRFLRLFRQRGGPSRRRHLFRFLSKATKIQGAIPAWTDRALQESSRRGKRRAGPGRRRMGLRSLVPVDSQFVHRGIGGRYAFQGRRLLQLRKPTRHRSGYGGELATAEAAFSGCSGNAPGGSGWAPPTTREALTYSIKRFVVHSLAGLSRTAMPRMTARLSLHRAGSNVHVRWRIEIEPARTPLI